MARRPVARCPTRSGRRPFTFPGIVAARAAQRAPRADGRAHAACRSSRFVLQVEGGSGADPADTGRAGRRSSPTWWTRAPARSAPSTCPMRWRASAATTTSTSAPTSRLLADHAGAVRRSRRRPAGRPARRGRACASRDFTRVRQLRLDRLRAAEGHGAGGGRARVPAADLRQHPYGHCRRQRRGAARAHARRRARRFTRERSGPRGATLVAVGALLHEELIALARRGVRRLDVGRATPARAGRRRRRCRRTAPPRLALVPREGAAQSELRIGHLSARRHAGLPGAAGDERPARRPVHQPTEPEAARGEGLHLRRLAPASTGGAGCRRSRSPRRACTPRPPPPPPSQMPRPRSRTSAAAGPVTGSELAHAKAALTRGYPRSFETARRWRAPCRSSRSTSFADTYLSSFVPTVMGSPSEDVTRVASAIPRSLPATALVVGDAQVVPVVTHAQLRRAAAAPPVEM